MKTSRYAPRTPAQSLAQSKADKIDQDKKRATRLLGRLRWKAELLMVSYYRTMEIVRADMPHDGGMDAQHTMESGATGKQAESMFKVDFFEFYALLERYITDCLAVLGFSVSASTPQNSLYALRYVTNPSLHITRPLASHAFHANLLEALDDEKCPLHGSLGIQEVRLQLGLAKDYRNAWKDADKQLTTSHSAEDYDARNISLHDLKLELMLRLLIAGCEHAHGVVQAYTNVDGNVTSRDFEPQTNGYRSMDIEHVPFEYMDDAMDLD